MFADGFLVQNGKLQLQFAPISGTPELINGVACQGGRPYVVDLMGSKIPSNAQLVNGLALTQRGALCVTSVDSPNEFINGFPTRNGVLCVDLVNTITSVNKNLPVTSSNKIPVYYTIPNVVDWWKYGVLITEAGTGVDTWQGFINAYKLRQTIDSKRPSLESDLSILFNGSSDFLSVAIAGLAQPTTVYLVGKQVTWTSGRYFYDGYIQDSIILYQHTATPKLAIYAGNILGDNADLPVDTYGVVTSVFNGASSLVQVNKGTAISGNAGALNGGGLVLGNRKNGSSYSHIQVKELIIYSAAHNSTQISYYESYGERVIAYSY